MTPPLVVPRDTVVVSNTSPAVTPPGAFSWAQGGVAQGRDFDRAGRSWRETYGLVRARSAGASKWLSRMRWFRARSKFFWVDHQLMHGSGLPIFGDGRENLLRDAAMDTDTDGDGVVDSFGNATNGTGFTFSVNATDGAQVISADGTGSSDDFAHVEQFILRVFPGDTLLASVDGRLVTPTDIKGRIFVQFRTADGTALSTGSITDFTSTSYARRVVSYTVPDEAAYARLILRLHLTAAGGSGDVRFRDARVIRAAADPATYANPHVSGGSQTGNSLATSGWPASTSGLLLPGDVFRIGGSAETEMAAETDEVARSFEVLSSVDSDGNGDATVEIDPPIFDASLVPDGAALRFESMRLRAFLSALSGTDAMSRAVDKYGGMSATFVEAI